MQIARLAHEAAQTSGVDMMTAVAERTEAEASNGEADVVAWQDSGLSEEVAEAVRQAVIKKFGRCERNLRPTRVRFLPTTKVPLHKGGMFEILANIVAESAKTNQFGFAPSEVIQAVVTFADDGDRQAFESVSFVH